MLSESMPVYIRKHAFWNVNHVLWVAVLVGLLCNMLHIMACKGFGSCTKGYINNLTVP